MSQLPEPPDRSGLYWPETAEEFAVVLIRDDRAAAALDPTAYGNGAHWFAPNDQASPMAWVDILADILGENAAPVSGAIRFTIPEVTP